MTEQRLREIEERAEKATPGPWLGFYDNDGGATEILVASKIGCGQDAFRHATCPVCAVDGSNQDGGLVLGWGSQVNKDNAEFIAHSRQDIPDLLEEVRRLKGLLEERS